MVMMEKTEEINEDKGIRPESLAASNLAEILRFLELNNDLTPYLSLYRILDTRVLDGIQVSKTLRLICEEKQISFLPERAKLLAGYGEYTYMKRKWKQLVRQQKRKWKRKQSRKNESLGDVTENDFTGATDEKLPEWEEVAKKVGDFALPVWEHVCDGDLFVGEWMPELGRFLE